jgi:hypothetical protein
MAGKEEKKDALVVDQNFDLDLFTDFASENGVTGLEALDQTDLKLPKVKIVQMTSEEFTKDGVKPGSFYNSVTKESHDELNCILLALGKSRVMWPPQFKRGDKPLCRSFNGKKKTEGCGDGVCESCQYAQWGANGEKADCTMGYVWLMLDDENRPCRFSAQGASVSPTKDFINSVAPKLKRGGKQLGIFVFKVKLSTEKQMNDKGTYFTVKYDIVGTINPEDYTDLENMSDSLRDLFLKAIDKDTQVVDSESYNEPENDGAPADNETAPKSSNNVLF